MTTLEEWKKQQMNVVCGIMDELVKRENINCGPSLPLITPNDPQMLKHVDSSIMNVLSAIESEKNLFKIQYEPPDIQVGGDPKYNAAVAVINEEARKLSEAAHPFKIWRREFNKIIAGYDELINMLKSASNYSSIQTEFIRQESILRQQKQKFTDVSNNIKEPASLLDNYPPLDISGEKLFTLLNNSYNVLIEYKLREKFAPEPGIDIKQKNNDYTQKLSDFKMYMNTKYGDIEKILKDNATDFNLIKLPQLPKSIGRTDKKTELVVKLRDAFTKANNSFKQKDVPSDDKDDPFKNKRAYSDDLTAYNKALEEFNKSSGLLSRLGRVFGRGGTRHARSIHSRRTRKALH